MQEYSFVVEPMRWRDVPEVMQIECEAFALPWPKNAYRYELFENEHSHYMVMRQVGVGLLGQLSRRLGMSAPLVGYGGFWMLVGEAHISTLAIAAEWRGRGLGAWLLWNLLERADQLDAFEATLEVRVSNHVAQSLYAKFGFVKVGERKCYYQDNGENAWIMTIRDFDSAACRARLAELGRELRQYTREPHSGQRVSLGL